MAHDDDGRRKGRYRNTPVDRAAGGVVVHQGRVLVVYRPRYDDWSLPKGHVKTGETWQQAALREVHEETGVTATIAAGAAVAGAYPVIYLVGRDVPKVVMFYAMRCDGEPGPLVVDPDEVGEAQWWEIDEAHRRLSYDVELEALAALLPAEGTATEGVPET